MIWFLLGLLWIVAVLWLLRFFRSRAHGPEIEEAPRPEGQGATEREKLAG